MPLHRYEYCGGNKFWLKFKQAENPEECTLGYHSESWAEDVRKWSSNKKQEDLWSDLGKAVYIGSTDKTHSNDTLSEPNLSLRYC